MIRVMLLALVGDGDVEMLVTDVDRYGRIVALLFREQSERGFSLGGATKRRQTTPPI